MSRMGMWMAVVAVAATVATVGGASDAHAAFGVDPSNFTAASSSTQAAGHPDASTEFTLNLRDPSLPDSAPDGRIRALDLDLPPGLVANPTLAPECTVTGVNFRSPTCPRESAVGTVDFTLFDATCQCHFGGVTRLYRVRAIGDEAAAFAFNALLFPVRISAVVGPETGYRVRTSIRNLNEAELLTRTKVTLWGVPADHQGPGPANDLGEDYDGSLIGAARRPFVTAPSLCDGRPLPTTLSLASWQTSQFIAPITASSPAVTGCDQLRFTPAVTVRPQTSVAAGPTGIAVDVTVPQADDRDALATPDLRDARVLLPAGMAISPPGADGLAACSDAQLAVGANAADTCPAAAKVGSVTIDTPLLADPLEGAVYVGTQLSDDPQSGRMFRLFITARAPGAVVKLVGAVSANPITGQLTTTFADNPQIPFSRLHVELDGGPRAVLANPVACGTYTAHSELTPWSSDTRAVSDSAFAVDQGCGDPSRFAPTFAAGSANPSAGAFSPFSVVIARSDADQELSTVDAVLPAGLVAKLAGVPQCADPQAAAGTCDPASRVGGVQVAVGSGSAPLWVPQAGKAPTAVYLAGPYKGAPFSLSIVVPAQAGPFDLGTVVVRAALFVDPNDARVTVQADPLPTIVRGVPLRMREIRVLMDRPGFMINPTSCAPSEVGAVLRPVAGAAATVASRYQAANCAALGYAPRLALGLSGKGQTTDGKHPALTAHLTTKEGDANSRRVKVTLPLSLALDPGNANALCEPLAAAANACPAASIVGRATARSILPDPLTGPVYFVRGERKDPKSGRVIKTLPKLFIPLSADNVTVYLKASSEVESDKLVTTFDTLPDVPFSAFDLDIYGGQHGILAVSGANVCAAVQVADGDLVAQSGRTASSAIAMTTQCTLALVASGHTPTALKMTIGGIGAGRVSVSGRGFATTRRTIGAATVATLNASLSQATRATLARHRNVKVKVSVAFTPKGAKQAKRVTKTLVIHGAKAPKR